MWVARLKGAHCGIPCSVRDSIYLQLTGSIPNKEEKTLCPTPPNPAAHITVGDHDPEKGRSAGLQRCYSLGCPLTQGVLPVRSKMFSVYKGWS